MSSHVLARHQRGSIALRATLRAMLARPRDRKAEVIDRVLAAHRSQQDDFVTADTLLHSGWSAGELSSALDDGLRVAFFRADGHPICRVADIETYSPRREQEAAFKLPPKY